MRSYALQVGLDPDATIEKFITQFPELAMTAAHAAAEQQEEEEQHDSNQQTAATFLRLVAISVPVVAGLLYLGTVSRRSAEPSRPPEPAPAAATTPQAPQGAGAPAPSRRPAGDTRSACRLRRIVAGGARAGPPAPAPSRPVRQFRRRTRSHRVRRATRQPRPFHPSG